MADDIKRGAVRIITDLTGGSRVGSEERRPGANMIRRDEVYREVRVLAGADLELARMLDEFDGKLRTTNEGLFDYASDVRSDILALNARVDALEEKQSRTIGARWDRFKARVAAAVLALVFAIDSPGESDPLEPEYPINYEPDAE